MLQVHICYFQYRPRNKGTKSHSVWINSEGSDISPKEAGFRPVKQDQHAVAEGDLLHQVDALPDLRMGKGVGWQPQAHQRGWLVRELRRVSRGAHIGPGSGWMAEWVDGG